MEAMKDWILTIAVCAVIIELINILMPEGSARKTAAIVCGIVLSLCIIIPTTSIYKNLGQLQFNYTENRNEILDHRDTYTEEQLLHITAEFKTKLGKHIEDLTLQTEGIVSCKAEIVMDENYNRDTYGQLHRIYIKAIAGKEKKEEKKPDSGFSESWKIDRIEIGIDGIQIIPREKEAKNAEPEDPRAKKIRESICKELQMEETSVFVEIQEENSQEG